MTEPVLNYPSREIAAAKHAIKLILALDGTCTNWRDPFVDIVALCPKTRQQLENALALLTGDNQY